MLSFKRKREKLENKEVVKIFLDIVKTLSRQDIAFRGNERDKNGHYRQNCCKALPFVGTMDNLQTIASVSRDIYGTRVSE